jgi:hypothetical protein
LTLRVFLAFDVTDIVTDLHFFCPKKSFLHKPIIMSEYNLETIEDVFAMGNIPAGIAILKLIEADIQNEAPVQLFRQLVNGEKFYQFELDNSDDLKRWAQTFTVFPEASVHVVIESSMYNHEWSEHEFLLGHQAAHQNGLTNYILESVEKRLKDHLTNDIGEIVANVHVQYGIRVTRQEYNSLSEQYH